MAPESNPPEPTPAPWLPANTVRMTVPPDNADEPELLLAPPHAKSREELAGELENIAALLEKHRAAMEPAPEPPKLQFSLQDLFLATTCASVGAAVAANTHAGVAVGLLGFIALAVLVLLPKFEWSPEAERKTWLILGVTYVCAALAVIVKRWLT